MSLSLAGLTKDANLQLIRDANNNRVFDAGDVLATSANRGVVGELIGERRAGGRHLLCPRLLRGGDTYYTLGITSRSVPPPDTPATPCPPPAAWAPSTTQRLTATDWLGCGGLRRLLCRDVDQHQQRDADAVARSRPMPTCS